MPTTTSRVGHSGAADAAITLCGVLDSACTDETVLVVTAVDGCDRSLLRTTAALPSARGTKWKFGISGSRCETSGFTHRCAANRALSAGEFDEDGRLPFNLDGGFEILRASSRGQRAARALRGLVAVQGRAGQRQIPDARSLLTHNLGGRPGGCVSFVSIAGTDLGTVTR